MGEAFLMNEKFIGPFDVNGHCDHFLNVDEFKH